MIEAADAKNRGPRILTLGLDRTGPEPKVLVHIVDGSGHRRGTLEDAQKFIDQLASDFPRAWKKVGS